MFCERLAILVKGKTVLEGKLSDIKKNYRKKNIHIICDINKKALEKIEGVDVVSSTPEEIIVTIEDEKYISNVFEVVKKHDNVNKFVVEDPSLNEIFVSIVGDVYED